MRVTTVNGFKVVKSGEYICHYMGGGFWSLDCGDMHFGAFFSKSDIRRVITSLNSRGAV